MSAVPKPKHRKQRKRFAARRDPAYMAWIHTQPCILAGLHHCNGPIEGAHVRSRAAGGDDANNLLSLCQRAHAIQHTVGSRSFASMYGIELKVEAARLWRFYQEQEQA